MEEDGSEVKLLRQLTKRKKTRQRVDKDEVEREEKKKKEKEEKTEENPVIKKIRNNIPAFMKKSKAKLAFDTLMFAGACVVVIGFGKVLNDSLDSCIPSEKEILQQMKMEQEMMMEMQRQAQMGGPMGGPPM